MFGQALKLFGELRAQLANEFICSARRPFRTQFSFRVHSGLTLIDEAD
jgi:hypothetical protein